MISVGTLRHVAVLVVVCLLAVACGQRAGDPVVRGGPTAAADPVTEVDDALDEASPDPGPAEAQEAEETDPESPDGPVEEPAEADAEPADVQAPPPARTVVETAWAPFATVGGMTLHHPSARVERVGFHESNHNGARQLEVLPTAADPVTLDSRDRGTGSRSAADVVVDPEVEIRSPVSGTVLRAGTYVLYCDYSDDFVVIEPDARPGWEVKLLHIDGVRVEPGQRVEAARTVLAPRPTPLPFESQVDEHTAEPSWPHVHLEVVDPTIPNPPSGEGC